MDPDVVDWSACDLVERVSGKVSGQPIVRGTRILADTIVQDAELGCSPEEIHENYPDLQLDIIHRLISYGRCHRIVAALDGATPQSFQLVDGGVFER